MSEPLDALRLPLWGSRLIEASAGTGKTWTIAALYLRLVLGHGDGDSVLGRPLLPAQILVMTFTRAATRELGDRIRARLLEAARCFRGEAAAPPGDDLLRGLLESHAPGEARSTAAWRLAMAAEAMDDAAVHTIDAWCQRMLREHAFDSGSLFDETLAPDETALLADAVRDYWRSEVYPLQGPALDAALATWAGVEAMQQDVRGLLRHPVGGVAADASLAELWQGADSRQAAAVAALKTGWADRVQVMRDWLLGQLEAGNCPFDRRKLAANHVRNWFDALGQWAEAAGPARPAFSDLARQRLTPDGLRACVKAGGRIEPPPVFDVYAGLLPALDALPEPTHEMRLHAAARVAARVRELKAAAGTYGYTDLLERLDAALAGPRGQRLRERIVEQYPAALVDEFQDTSPLQYRIFERLYRPAANDRGAALLLIGDPKQSIYAFRGADIRSYLRARSATAGRHYLLDTNFRSTRPLVEAVNHLFGQAEARAGQGAFLFRHPGPAGADDPLPFVAVQPRDRPEQLVTGAGTLPAVTLCHEPALLAAADVLERYGQRCAEHIATLLGDAAAGLREPGGLHQPLRPADIAVLVRDRHEAQAVRRALRQRRIASVYLSDQDSVFASAEASDLLRWLRAVADPLDTRLVRAALASASVGLPLAELARLRDDEEAFDRHVELLRQVNALWRRQGVLAMLRQSLHRLDLPARWLAQADGERRLTNVLHLAELLQAAAGGLDGEQALVRWLAQRVQGGVGAAGDEQVLRLESDADLVRVVTVHKSKGLEFPIVCLPYACSFRAVDRRRQRFLALPADTAGERHIDFSMGAEALAAADHERLQEDLRLLYVAVTRARHALWLGVAAARVGRSAGCVFHRSALGRLLAGERDVAAADVGPLLKAAVAGLGGVVVELAEGDPPLTRLRRREAPPALVEPPRYEARFERNWSIASFSALVRELPAAPARRLIADPVAEEELLVSPAEAAAQPAPAAPARHRFPRGALAGNFLHEQLEWLAGQGYAGLDTDEGRQRLQQRCDRQGWGPWGAGLADWLGDVVSLPLPPLGAPLRALRRPCPELEFWLPSAGAEAAQVDTICRAHLLAGRPRPALPQRQLHGMLMGFADLVFKHQGRYWVLDYKSNALGPDDAAYTGDAMAAAMAEHRYDVQAAIYLLALHRLLRSRLGLAYDPARQIGGAIFHFLRGVRGPEAGCCVLAADMAWLQPLDAALAGPEAPA